MFSFRRDKMGLCSTPCDPDHYRTMSSALISAICGILGDTAAGRNTRRGSGGSLGTAWVLCIVMVSNGTGSLCSNTSNRDKGRTPSGL